MQNITEFINESISHDYVKNIRYDQSMYNEICEIMHGKSNVEFEFDVDGKMFKIIKKDEHDVWEIIDDKGKSTYGTSKFKKALRYLVACPDQYGALVKSIR